MREPELVVQYLATTEVGSVSSEYGGVFKPERTLDRPFARAEPPTHDAWHPELVDETKLRRFVAVALRTVRERAKRFAERDRRTLPAVRTLRRWCARSMCSSPNAIATLGQPAKQLPDAVVGQVDDRSRRRTRS